MPTAHAVCADVILQLDEPEEFEHWEKLVRAAEAQEGGLNRNSSPGAIASTRDVYDNFLARFPLFFGYWKKYADLEFTVAGTEAAEMVSFPGSKMSQQKLTRYRSTSAASLALAYPLTYGPTTAASRSKQVMSRK
jgi:hypothetical protein